MASLRVEMMVVLTALRRAARSVEWKECSLDDSRESMKVEQMVCKRVS